MKQRWCKTALSPSGLPGLDYALNPYRGCAHGCRYCYVPAVLHQPRGELTDVAAKVNIPQVLRRELKRKRQGIVGIATVTDPYQPAERDCRLIRKCLPLLCKHDMAVDIQTKSPLVTRDIDLLHRFQRVAVGVTVTTLDEDTRRLLEPGAPPVEQRLAALQELSDSDIATYVFFGPILPDLEVADAAGYVQRFADAGADELMVDTLHLKKGVWESIAAVLPDGKRELYQRRLQPGSSYYQAVVAEIEKTCRHVGLPYTRAFR
ncbi:MAG: radical SAM protein [Thermoplasmatota archaeon]